MPDLSSLDNGSLMGIFNTQRRNGGVNFGITSGPSSMTNPFVAQVGQQLKQSTGMAGFGGVPPTAQMPGSQPIGQNQNQNQMQGQGQGQGQMQGGMAGFGGVPQGAPMGGGMIGNSNQSITQGFPSTSVTGGKPVSMPNINITGFGNTITPPPVGSQLGSNRFGTDYSSNPYFQGRINDTAAAASSMPGSQMNGAFFPMMSTPGNHINVDNVYPNKDSSWVMTAHGPMFKSDIQKLTDQTYWANATSQNGNGMWGAAIDHYDNTLATLGIPGSYASYASRGYTGPNNSSPLNDPYGAGYNGGANSMLNDPYASSSSLNDPFSGGSDSNNPLNDPFGGS